MEVKGHSDSDSRSQSCPNSDEEGANSLRDSQFVVVKLEDEETEMDLSIFAPVECEEEENEDDDELSDSSGVSTWKRNIQERGNQEDSVPPEKASRSLKEQHKNRQILLAEQRQNLGTNSDHSAANRDMNVQTPLEEHTFYQAVPPVKRPLEISGPNTAVSPLAAMEPPVFPNAPVQSKSVVGEDQQSILLEVLNHCRFLHEAVQRLEQKIDRHMSNEPPCKKSSARQKNASQKQASLMVEENQLSWSLAQRLGPPVQRNARWIPPWKRGADMADLQQVESSGLQMGKPPRGRGRGRGRGRRGRSNASQHQSQIPDPAVLMSKPFKDEICTASTHNPQPSQVVNEVSPSNIDSKCQQKRKKCLANVDGERDEPEMNMEVDTSEVQEDNKVMIGSPLRKVCIPLSVYRAVFREAEPQKAVVLVLHALFPISTLSCSAVTGNPAKGIQQLDPNKIEALREFLAEMYPQFDVGVRGVSWAQCLGVINRMTKNLKKIADKKSHQPEEVGDGRNYILYS